MSSPVVRFAPSPTGRMHVGNIRTALINYLFAKKHGGKFILRIDDTDTARSTDEFLQGIFEDLKWVGIQYDECFHQSHRFDRYDVIKQQLIDKGLLYACYETAEELEAKRKILLGRGLPPVYDRAHLKLTDAEKQKFESDGRKAHWRFLLPDKEIKWTDLVRGPFNIHTSTMSDPILVREDGTYLYTLPSVIDDVDRGITHIFRGEDHIYNTAAQIPIFDAILNLSSRGCEAEPGTSSRGFTQILFGHMSFFTGPKGEALSKRLGSISLQDLKAEGIEPLVILSYLRYLGTPLNVHLAYSMDELLADFDMTHFGGNAPKFDPEILKQLNHKWLAGAPYSWLAEEGIAVNFPEEAWHLIRFNVQTREEIDAWNEIFSEDFNLSSRGLAFVGPGTTNIIKVALELLPTTWDSTTWATWTNAIKSRTNLSGKALYMPLRQALTGHDHGPEMKLLLPLLKREWVVQRLNRLAQDPR